jgi:hypothetical protein
VRCPRCGKETDILYDTGEEDEIFCVCKECLEKLDEEKRR